jgi:hypothetical protein
MNLILINTQFMRNNRLLRQKYPVSPNRIRIQQAILRPYSPAQRLRHGIKVAWDSHQTRMASIRRINFAVGGQDGISAALAETNGSNLPGARNIFDS